ncbi:hypothetical protein KC19_5G033600 [Ceratodon purpureus]|uniref:Uncharacterized protein n=1 Tax=Ceratodon purpureus TaxID=3225 RepID=A0A8T0HXK4_CERPU|nr:hypothetical protein KC19_5G033600 [Ceratodon purpureus]
MAFKLRSSNEEKLHAEKHDSTALKELRGAASPAQLSASTQRQDHHLRTATLKSGPVQLKSPVVATVLIAFVFSLPGLAASQTLEAAFSQDAKLDYFCCTLLFSWWAGTWFLLRICEIHWKFNWYCILQRLKFVGGLLICASAAIGFTLVVFWSNGSTFMPQSSGTQTGPQISATLSTFLVWFTAGGCGVWIGQGTMRQACALSNELATPRYRITFSRYFPNATSTLLAGSGISSEVQVMKAHLPVRYTLSGWSLSPTRWWAQQWQYYWNGHVFWDSSNAEMYVVMRSTEERLGPESGSMISMNLLQSNDLGLGRIRIQAMLARLPNYVWQAQVCREIVTMLLKDEDVRSGLRSNNGELCGVKLIGGIVPFEEEDAYLVNARSLASVGLLALWEDERVFCKLQRFIEDMYAALSTAVSRWQDDEVRDKVRELALEVLLSIKEAKIGKTLVEVAVKHTK